MNGSVPFSRMSDSGSFALEPVILSPDASGGGFAPAAKFATCADPAEPCLSKNSCPPLPANSDATPLPLDQTHSEFVGRGAGGEGICSVK